MDVVSWPSGKILVARPSQLFSDKKTADAVHKAFVKKWHPDRNKDPHASDVVAHINAAYTEAKKAFEAGGFPDALTIKMPDGSDAVYVYLAVLKTELGELYICKNHIIYANERKYDDLARRALSVSKAFKFPNADVEAKFRPNVPRNIRTIANKDRAYTIMARDRDYVRVADIIAKGPVDPRHAAWIMSRAYNIAGWMSYSSIQHLDISPETMFVEPSSHHGALLGGWFYSSHGKDSPIAAPARSAHLAKTRKAKAHLAMIRVLGRRILGCNTISEVKKRTDIPGPLKSWLTSAAGDDAVKEEKLWKQVLIDSFGPNRFTVMDLTTKDIYG